MNFKDFLLYDRGVTLEQAREQYPLTRENAKIVAEAALDNALDNWEEISDALWPDDPDNVAVSAFTEALVEMSAKASLLVHRRRMQAELGIG